jgi:hypothetical protein
VTAEAIASPTPNSAFRAACRLVVLIGALLCTWCVVELASFTAAIHRGNVGKDGTLRPH